MTERVAQTLGAAGGPTPWMELLEFCWQIDAYIDAAERLMAETQTDITVERLLEEAHRQPFSVSEPGPR